MHILYGLLLPGIAIIATTDSSPCTIYDYPGCESECLINNQNQINGELYRVNNKCYKAITNCYGCLSNPDSISHSEALKPVPCDCSEATVNIDYPGCLIYDWPKCEPNCLVNSVNQEQGSIYRVGGQCYQAITGCSGCLGNPDAYSSALQPIDCDCSTYNAERDCSVLAIDKFLLQCSEEFSQQNQAFMDLQSEVSGINSNMIAKTTANGNDIAALKTDVGSIKHEIKEIEMNANDIEELAQMIASIESNMTSGSEQLSQQVITIEETIMGAVNERLDAFAAKAPNVNVDTVLNGNHSTSLFTMKDLLIVSLLITNLFMMWYVYCYGYVVKENKKKKEYIVQYDEESDLERINK